MSSILPRANQESIVRHVRQIDIATLLLGSAVLLTVFAVIYQMYMCGIDSTLPLPFYLCTAATSMWACVTGYTVCRLVERTLNATRFSD